MVDQLAGLRDKLYWRPRVTNLITNVVWHCFKKREGGGYVSLCGRAFLERSGGQKCWRPPAIMRCGMCDGREIVRRGKDESMPESPDWRSAW